MISEIILNRPDELYYKRKHVEMLEKWNQTNHIYLLFFHINIQTFIITCCRSKQNTLKLNV